MSSGLIRGYVGQNSDADICLWCQQPPFSNIWSISRTEMYGLPLFLYPHHLKAKTYIYTVDGSPESVYILNLHWNQWVKWHCLLQRTVSITNQVRKTSKHRISKEGFQQLPYQKSPMFPKPIAFLLCNIVCTVMLTAMIKYKGDTLRKRFLNL